MPAAIPLPLTLGELRTSERFSETRLKTRNVKDELRANLIARLKSRETIFPGIVGFDDTVIPQIVNAILSRQNFILLGLRGQAKSRILRALTALLDEKLPYIAGCEIRDNPYTPICRRCCELVRQRGDATPIAYLNSAERYVEKLATPDVTVADLIGDLDPIKAARGGEDLSSELTMHYGLLPRANRGIFAINGFPQPPDELLETEQAQTATGELDRQRQSIEYLDELSRRRIFGERHVQPFGGPRQQGDRVGLRESVQMDLPFARAAQRQLRRRKHAQIGQPRQQGFDQAASAADLLEVVQHEQQRPARSEVGDDGLLGRPARVDPALGRDCRQQPRDIALATRVGPPYAPYATPEHIVGYRERHARLADATTAQQRDKPVSVSPQCPAHTLEVSLSPHQTDRGRRQVSGA